MTDAPHAPDLATDPAALDLPPDRLRALGHRVVDLVVDHWTTLRDQPAGRRADRATLARLLDEEPPETGRDVAAVLERLERDVFAHMGRVHHPRFFAFVPSPSNIVSVFADALVAGHNVFAGTWFESSGPAMVELVALEWLRGWCGLPEEAGGLFTSGGSMANLTGLAVARHAVLGDDVDGVVLYASDQSHSAVARAVWALGFPPGALRMLPSNPAFRLDPDLLAAEIRADRAAGRRPFCVVANAGTTNTGAVDPLPALADLAAREGLWLHVDAAYGGPAVLTARGRAALDGLGRADSLALDPHKWLFQPYEIGCALVRREGLLEETFRARADYLRDVHAAAEVDFGDRGLQLTRSFRALKLWLSIQVFGVAAFRAAVERGIEAAERAEALLRAYGRWEIVTPASLAVVTFRWAPPGVPGATARAVNDGLVEAALADGTTLVSSTTLRGETAIRLCTINPRTTDDDLRLSVERLGELAEGLAAGAR